MLVGAFTAYEITVFIEWLISHVQLKFLLENLSLRVVCNSFIVVKSDFKNRYQFRLNNCEQLVEMIDHIQ